jgi:hypothetical protein
MAVTPDVIGVLIALATLVGALFGGIWALLARQTATLEKRFDERFQRIDERFDKVDARFDKVDARFERVEDEIAVLRDGLTEVKIAIARLEGPPPRLVPLR